MRRNNELIRRILEHCEGHDSRPPIPDFDGVTKEEIEFHLELCGEDGWLELIPVAGGVAGIRRMTSAGHDELERLRQDDQVREADQVRRVIGFRRSALAARPESKATDNLDPPRPEIDKFYVLGRVHALEQLYSTLLAEQMRHASAGSKSHRDFLVGIQIAAFEALREDAQHNSDEVVLDHNKEFFRGQRDGYELIRRLLEMADFDPAALG